MIFSELYSAYYNTVAKILRTAMDHPISDQEMRRIIESEAFSESILMIQPAFKEERWQLLHKDGSTPLKHMPSMPLSLLQKRWLKSISLDPRMKLFDFDLSGLEEVEPLFEPEDVYIFDQYADGDPYQDETYIKNFRMILDAIKSHNPLSIHLVNRNGEKIHRNVMPEYLEYSEKDDKFRLFTTGCRHGRIINLGRILSCQPYTGEVRLRSDRTRESRKSIVIELFNGRNALERVMLHFAHFEKAAQKIDDRHYRVEIHYSGEDETELVIRVLSFGPFIKVVEPESFVDQIKDRLKKQKSCEL